jgi:hypothetical protein
MNKFLSMQAVWPFLIASMIPITASATTHVACVANAADLTNALSSLQTSASNSDADEIRVHVGQYSAPVDGFVGAVTNHHDLTIRGGYTDAECTQQTLDASFTVLDGNHASGVLTINTPLLPISNIEVSGLTFQNGSGGNAFESNAGGLKIGDPNPINNGTILVERNIFRNNSAASNGFSQAVGGLMAATDGTSLIVRGNLFVNNKSPNAPAADLESNNEIDVSNNTFVDNTATDSTQPTRVMLDYITFAGLKLSNNIFWGNATGPGAFDVNLSPKQFAGLRGATLTNNDIEAATGTAVAATGTLHVDPAFADNGNFRLGASSTLINAGVNSPTGGLTDVDLDGKPRIVGSAVDLGAYESASVSTGPSIAGGFSGNWYDPTPNQAGHGFQIEVLPNNGLLAIWFVFNPAGTAQNWIYLQGSYDTNANTATLPAFLEQGGRFPPHFDSSKITALAWGSLTFTFSDCNNGTATWKSNAASAAAGYGDISFPIQRLTSIAGTTCH